MADFGSRCACDGLGSVARDAWVVARKKEKLVTWGPSTREGKKPDQTRSEVKVWLAPGHALAVSSAWLEVSGPRIRDIGPR
jgi:hypothetical protein